VKGPGRLQSSWALLLAVIVLIAGPLLLYWFFPAVGVPTTIALGMIAVIAIKHLGLLAILLGPLYALIRRVRR
jgi:hypothetical protein